MQLQICVTISLVLGIAPPSMAQAKNRDTALVITLVRTSYTDLETHSFSNIIVSLKLVYLSLVPFRNIF